MCAEINLIPLRAFDLFIEADIKLAMLSRKLIDAVHIVLIAILTLN